MGGSTVLRVAESDKRVKCVLTQDPWLFPLNQEITEGKFNKFQKGIFAYLLNSQSFFKYSKLSGFDPQKCFEKLRDD